MCAKKSDKEKREMNREGHDLLNRMKLDGSDKMFVQLQDRTVLGEFPNTYFLVS